MFTIYGSGGGGDGSGGGGDDDLKESLVVSRSQHVS